jgi:hypothetical protein
MKFPWPMSLRYGESQLGGFSRTWLTLAQPSTVNESAIAAVIDSNDRDDRGQSHAGLDPKGVGLEIREVGRISLSYGHVLHR